MGTRTAAGGIKWFGGIIEDSGSRFEVIQIENEHGGAIGIGMSWSF